MIGGMETYSETKKQVYEFMLSGRDFHFILENNFTPKTVLEKILHQGARMTFSLPLHGNSVHCKIGKNLVTFAQRRRHEWLATQLDMGRQIHGVITKASGKLPNRVVFVTVSYSADDLPVIITLPESPKTIATETSDKERSRSVRVGISKQRIIAKHPLTNIGFYPHKNFFGSCKKEVGKAGVYCIYNKDFKTYIGQSLDIAQRWRTHFNNLNNGSHHNPQLQEDWSILGASGFVFKVIQYSSHELLNDLERHYIQIMKGYGSVYNTTDDGQGKLPTKLDEPVSNSIVPNVGVDNKSSDVIQNLIAKDLLVKPIGVAGSFTEFLDEDEKHSDESHDLTVLQILAEKQYWANKNKAHSIFSLKPVHPRVSKKLLMLLKFGSWFSYSCYRKFRFLNKRFEAQNKT